MDNSIRNKLEEEVRMGIQAQSLYDTFVGEYVASERLLIFQQFCIAPIEGAILLTALKYEQMALDKLEQHTLTLIDTGKMAQSMLSDFQQ